MRRSALSSKLIRPPSRRNGPEGAVVTIDSSRFFLSDSARIRASRSSCRIKKSEKSRNATVFKNGNNNNSNKRNCVGQYLELLFEHHQLVPKFLLPFVLFGHFPEFHSLGTSLREFLEKNCRF